MAKKQSEKRWFVIRCGDGRAELCKQTSQDRNSGWPVAISDGYGKGKGGTGVGTIYRVARLLNADDEKRRQE